MKKKSKKKVNKRKRKKILKRKIKKVRKNKRKKTNFKRKKLKFKRKRSKIIKKNKQPFDRIRSIRLSKIRFKKIRVPKLKFKKNKLLKIKKKAIEVKNISFQKLVNFILTPIFRAYDDFREKRKIEKIKNILVEKKEKERKIKDERRLRYETKRRLNRLFITFYQYISDIVIGKKLSN